MRLHARLLCLAIAIAIAAPPVPASAGADQSSCQPGPAPAGADPSAAGGVNIHVTASDTVMWCSAAVIEANSDIAPGTEYPERATSQSPSSNPVSNAISINRLLTIAQVNPATVSFTYIVRPSNGTWSTLSTADLTAQPTTFESGLKPIVWINGGETDYLRPLRGPTDTNADDLISDQSGTPVDLYVSSGPLLEVTASATPTKVHIKQPVSFAARVAGLTPHDGNLIYKWTFQDGLTATGSTVTHSFGFTGTFAVIVTVQGSGDDSGGASEPIPVNVGNPPKAAANGKPLGTSANRNVTPGGATDSKGENPQTAPTHRPSRGSNMNRRSSHSQAAGQSGNAASQSTALAQTTTPRTAAPPQAATPQTATPPQTTRPRTATPPQSTTLQTTTSANTTSVPAATTSNKPAAKADYTGTNRRRSAARSRVAPRRSQEATVVRGRLIADVIPLSVAKLAVRNRAARPPAAQAHAPSASVGGGSVAPIAGIAGGCAIMLLLGSGAGLELRSQRRSVARPRAG
jgi:hypothetical protein